LRVITTGTANKKKVILDKFFIHTHLFWHKENDITMKKKCVTTLEVHCRTTIVGVFGGGGQKQKQKKNQQNSAMAESAVDYI
jgi:hypothetical protein